MSTKHPQEINLEIGNLNVQKREKKVKRARRKFGKKSENNSQRGNRRFGRRIVLFWSKISRLG
jgi:hypothetical protein